ncbi:MAG: 7-carboxy-7-deazaguanine synthase QueE [Candidatus Omnitrophota bacterium]|jgi:organic radical activating enzyme
MKDVKADVTEIFSSIQGEGIFVGMKQIFVRFKSCNLSCSFCDEISASASKKYSPEELLAEILAIESADGPHHSVSFTGGEPLLYTEFLIEVLKLLEKEKIVSYLETNGTLPVNLAKIIDRVDIVSMDIKLPSSTGEKEYWAEHSKFLKTASKKDVFVKIVVTPNTVKEDVEKAAAIMKGINKKIPLILQPVTPMGPLDTNIDNETLLDFMNICLRGRRGDTRIIPQVHKRLGQR